MAVNRTLSKIEAFPIAHFKDNAPNFSKHMLKLAIPSKIWVSDPPPKSVDPNLCPSPCSFFARMVWGNFLGKNLFDFFFFWGGGLNPCPDGLGHFYRDEVPQNAWLSAGEGGRGTIAIQAMPK